MISEATFIRQFVISIRQIVNYTWVNFKSEEIWLDSSKLPRYFSHAEIGMAYGGEPEVDRST